MQQKRTFESLPVGEGIVHEPLVLRSGRGLVQEGWVGRCVRGTVLFYLRYLSRVRHDRRQGRQLLVLGTARRLKLLRRVFRHPMIGCLLLLGVGWCVDSTLVLCWVVWRVCVLCVLKRPL